MRLAMKASEQPERFEELVRFYQSLFTDTDDFARASWFFAVDESVILSFDVGRDEPIEKAEARHHVKLLAIASALESLPCAAKEQSAIDSLRSMVTRSHN